MANKVEICGVNTAKLPLYKDADMKEMMAKIKGGDREARDAFIPPSSQQEAVMDTCPPGTQHPSLCPLSPRSQACHSGVWTVTSVLAV